MKLDKTVDQSAFLLRCYANFYFNMDEQIKYKGISPRANRSMWFLYIGKPGYYATINFIARKCHMGATSTIKHIILDIEHRGLLTRLEKYLRAGKTNRKIDVYRLSTQGRQFVESMIASAINNIKDLSMREALLNDPLFSEVSEVDLKQPA